MNFPERQSSSDLGTMPRAFWKSRHRVNVFTIDPGLEQSSTNNPTKTVGANDQRSIVEANTSKRAQADADGWQREKPRFRGS